jgi:hypothetical protein
MRDFTICAAYRVLFGGGVQMKENEMGGECGRHRERREMNTVQGFGEES